MKQDQKREERIKGLMEYSFDVCNAFGEVWMSEDLQACALILFPDKKRTSLKTILWDLKLALSVIGFDRVSTVLKRESMIKNHHPKEPFAYLWFIGVNPSKQNKGIGSAFIKEVIDKCVERNLPFYQKFGFEIFKSLDLSYKLYQLRRV